MNRPNAPPAPNWVIAELYALRCLATSLLSLWVSSVSTEEEAIARVEAIRSTAKNGAAGFPENIRSHAEVLIAEMFDQAERDIKKRRAAIWAAPSRLQ